MTATVDLGRSAKQIPPHPGDAHAQRIRATLQRLCDAANGSSPASEEETR